MDNKFGNPLADPDVDYVPSGADDVDRGLGTPQPSTTAPLESVGASAVSQSISTDLSMMQLIDDSEAEVDREEEREKRHAEALEYMANHFIITPEGGFRHRWDVMQMILLVYVAVLIPYRIGFDQDAKPWQFGFVFDIFVDIYFIVDIWLSFRTAVYDKHGELIYTPKPIAASYLRGWFVIDTLGCLPINYVMLIMESGQEGNSTGKANKAFRILRLFKLLKLLRLARLKRLIARYEEEFYALASGFAIIKICIAVVSIGHWLACLWYGVGTIQEICSPDGVLPPKECVDPEGQPIKTWTEIEFGGAARGTSNGVRYLTSLYWAFMTMTTVGYGDLPANTTYEKWAAVLGMLVGGFTFGLIVGALGEMARKANPGEAFRSKKIAQVSTYLARRGVTPDLLRRIRLYFQNHYEIASVFSTQEYTDYFTRLPTEHRLQLAKEVGYLDSAHRPGVLAKISSFSGLDTMSLILVCTKLKTELYEKSTSAPIAGDAGIPTTRETVCRRGEHAWELIVVLEGIANVTDADGDDEHEFLHHSDEEALAWTQQVKMNDFIDEHVALLPPHSTSQRTQTLYAQTDLQIALLSAEDVYMLRSERPAIDRHLRPYAAAAQRDETIRQVNKIFESIDKDGSGEIDQQEFVGVMRSLGSDLPEAKIHEVFATIDVDAGGSIDVDEFTEWWLSQQSADTSTKEDGSIVTNKEEFDLQSLKRDMADLDKMTAGMQAQLQRICELVEDKLKTTSS
jgi:hypothetical protein